MTRQQVFLRSSTPSDRRRPLLENMYSSRGGLRRRHLRPDISDYSSSSRDGSRRARLAEVAGGTTAECAAVACCCPCGLANLVVLAAFKLPAGLCRKALRRRRRRHVQKDALQLPLRRCSCPDSEVEIVPITNPLAMVSALESDNSEVIELDKEMWDRFYSTGFWRSPSQRN